ncbi:MAG: hypothetical protein ACI4W2_11710 [Eubacterium sp.]
MIRNRKKLSAGLILLLSAAVMMASCGTALSDSSADSSSESKSSSTAASGLTYVSPSQLSSTSSTSTSSSKSSKGGPGGPGGANTSTYDYTGSNSGKLTANGKKVTAKNKSISTSKSDQNVLLAKNGGSLKGSGLTLKKSGSDSNGDNCNFYGLNSSVLAVGSKSSIYLANSSLTSTSTGSNGLFATNHAKIYANNDKITTKSGANSRGLDATYGGVIYANKMNISTAKDHSAAIATDRGGGYISVTNSKLKTAGSGSPLLYSTGDIEVNNVTGTASGSQIAGMEGKNRILIYNSSLTSTNDARSGSDPIKNGVILYQSTSGDADTSSSSKADFEAVNSTLKTSISSGAMFYVTNTDAKVVLKNTKLNFNSSKVNLIYAAGNSNNWGTAGKNGGTLTFTGIGETLKGNVVCDSISKVNLYLLNGTTYTGKTVKKTNSSASSSKSGTINVSLDKNSKWIVTGNCTVSSLTAADGSKIVDKDGKTVTIKVNGKTVVKGTSSYTVNVTGKYSTTLKTTSSNSTSKKVLSRTAFDKYYGISTKFGTNA